VSAPKCQFCGKQLAKRTSYYLFREPVPYRAAGFEEFAPGHRRPVYEQQEKPEGHRERESDTGSWLIYTANRPRTKAECQRYTNHPITSVRRHYDGETIGSFNTWDGESYERRFKFFCTVNCAAKFGQIMAEGEV
jgi:hypothetical protein